MNCELCGKCGSTDPRDWTFKHGHALHVACLIADYWLMRKKMDKNAAIKRDAMRELAKMGKALNPS